MTLTEQQLKQRMGGIGGSDIGAIVGLNKYRNAHDVWAEKTGLRPSPYLDNPYIRFGDMMEPVLIDEYRNLTGRIVTTPDGTVAHPERSWHLASVDGLVMDGDRPAGVLEAKTAGWRMASEWGEDGTDDVPSSYLVQCAWYMIPACRRL